ncbi:MAG: septum site-determining protein MinC [Cyanobacteria bacterium K_DeepCast_35m_m2_155]|nr:septum site-determining protein MinC [Cyanobacteria bacterium K_DeepCast_35m_m2_155]
MAELALREGLDQPRPLAQIEALLADVQHLTALADAHAVHLLAGGWLIGMQELSAIAAALADHGLTLQAVVSSEPRTRVAAASLGLSWSGAAPAMAAAEASGEASMGPAPLRIHQGTLRSGDHLEAEGSLLVLGDVNPGARVSATGHVLVWGTLRGVAHAGCSGDSSARISALQLRPLQLRIASAVARGPEDLPVPGVAEQAELIDGVIAINPAAPQWPLG